MSHPCPDCPGETITENVPCITCQHRAGLPALIAEWPVESPKWMAESARAVLVESPLDGEDFMPAVEVGLRDALGGVSWSGLDDDDLTRVVLRALLVDMAREKGLM